MLIDVHCHTNLYLVVEDIIKEAKNEGVGKIISCAMSFTSLERIIELCSRSEMLYPALGIHPEEVKENRNIGQQLNEVIEIISRYQNEICAIGEVGLDHHFVKDKTLYPLQMEIFKRMLTIAEEIGVPVNLHTKGAEEEVFHILSSYKIQNVNIHWYSGPDDLLKEGIDRGYYFSITPAIHYSPASKKVVMTVDNDHLLLESDGPVKSRGITWTPSMIRDILKTIASLKKIKPEDLENQIYSNTKKAFPRIFKSS